LIMDCSLKVLGSYLALTLTKTINKKRRLRNQPDIHSPNTGSNRA